MNSKKYKKYKKSYEKSYKKNKPRNVTINNKINDIILKTRKKYNKKGGLGDEYNENITDNIAAGVGETNDIVDIDLDVDKRMLDDKMKNILNDKIKNILNENIINKNKNLSNLLQIICKNSTNCLSFSYYNSVIKHLFDNFNLKYINNKKIIKIGEVSANGYILLLPFEKLSYTVYAALKFALKAHSDNLYYEYIVGKYFINKQINKLPCFLETYHLYLSPNINSTKYYDIINNSRREITFSLKDELIPVITDEHNFDYGLSCDKPLNLCLLMQYFNNFISFKNYFQEIFNEDDLKDRLSVSTLFYQVYFPLTVLSNNYTHYDLHAKNAFLYKPFDGKQCIKMIYHTNNNIITFLTEYIVKIIDYGRNHFNNGILNTDIFMNNICNTDKCKPTCGSKYGYVMIQGHNTPHIRESKIFPRKPNISHDLRLAHILRDILIDKIHICDNIVYDNNFGTKELLSDDIYNGIVKNIFDMRKALENNLLNYDDNYFKDIFNEYQIVAEMHIYEDGRDYEFNILPTT